VVSAEGVENATGSYESLSEVAKDVNVQAVLALRTDECKSKSNGRKKLKRTH
jgi:hypothetical protein